MTTSEVLKLIDAGFSSNEIRKMEETPAESPEEIPAGTPEETPAETPAETPDPNTEVVELKTKISEMEKIIKDLQDGNLKKNYIETPDDPINKNIESFLKSL